MILVNKDFLISNQLQPVENFNNLLLENVFEFTIIFSKDQNLYIVCIYRSPLSDVNDFFHSFDTLLSSISVSSSIIVSGDFNINYEDSNSISTIRLKNLLESHNLQMHVNSPTRVSQHSSTLIDYVCSNFNCNTVDCSVIDAGLSDHNAVVCKFLRCPQRSVPRYKYGRIFSQANYDRFYQSCAAASWDDVIVSRDPIQTFHGILSNIFNAVFPQKKIRKKTKKPWFTRGLKVSSANLRSLHMVRKYTDSEEFFDYFNKYRALYRKLIKTAKQTYYSGRLHGAANKQKESWSIVNDIRQNNGTSRDACESQMSPDTVNNFYCSIAGNLTRNLVQSVDPLRYLSGVSVENSFYFLPTDVYELKEAISGVRTKNSSGVDGMSAKIYLNLPATVLDILAQAINISWESGIFSPCLRSAKVIPLYKGGDIDEPSNYRPISLLSTLSKIIEKLVKSRMTSFINVNNILNSSQFGFQEEKSTNDAMFRLLEDLYSRINRGGVAAAAFCDLSKAFDCVSHKILLRKLHSYGFRGVALSWFESYLAGRHQRVFMKSGYSGSRSIDWGVPQGSVLGPTLFLLFINDLPTLDISGRFTLFADDTTVLWHCKDLASLNVSVSDDIKKIRAWCDANLLLLNFEKTNIVSFKCHMEGLVIGDTAVESRTSAKFLGLIIDNELRFESHIIDLGKRVASGCYAVKITVNELGPSMGRAVYYSLIESRLRYGICFWGMSGLRLLNSLFVLQKRAVRYLSRARPLDSCRPLFLRHKILTLYSLFILESVCIVYKNRHNLISPNSRYNTRQLLNLPLPIPTLTLTKKSIIYESIKMYNHLPNELKVSPTLKLFKNGVRKLLIGRAYYGIDEFYRDFEL